MSSTPTPAPTKSAAISKPLLLRALAGERVARPPIWLFRQAGRYLPEYRELRARGSFEQLCRTPELACEATLQPIRRFALDAAIVFSDLLVPLEGLGHVVRHGDHGPELADPPRSSADAIRVAKFEANDTTTAPARTLRLLARELPPHVARIGFTGAPLTLALYLLEGKGSKNFERARSIAFGDEPAFQKLLEHLALGAAEYAKAQVEGGAQVVQLFDSWGGLLAPTDWRRLVLPAARELVRRVREIGVPVIWFVRGSADHARAASESGADAVSVDWTVDLPAFVHALETKDASWKSVTSSNARGVGVQGNLDPALLVGEPDVAARHARELVRAMDGHSRWIFNVGHGITPDARVESVAAVVDAVVHGETAQQGPGASR